MMVSNEVRVVSWIGTNDFTNFPALAQKFTPPVDAVSTYLWNRFSARTRQLMTNATISTANRDALAKELNKIVLGVSIYEQTRFADVVLSAETQQLRLQKLQGVRLNRINRLLLEDAYLGLITRGAANTNNLYLALNLSNGAYSGSFTNPITGLLTPFKGALLQPAGYGSGNGWFLGTNQGGFVYISDGFPLE